MNSFFSGTFTYARVMLRRFFRDRVAMFFTILFPLIFLVIFGSLFGNNSNVTFEVAIIDQAQNDFSKPFVENAQKDTTFAVSDITNKQAALDAMTASKLDSVIVLPESFGVPNQQGLPSGKATVYYDKGSPQAGQIVGQILDKILSGISSDITKTKPLFTVEQQSVQTNNLRPFDYVFSGLVGFSILSLGIFGLAQVMPSQKQKGVLRRLHVSPFSSIQLTIGTMLYYLGLGFVSITLLTVSSVVFFGLDMRGSWLLFILICIIGLIMTIGIGLAVGGWAKNENQAAPLSNLIAFPLMFLSGAFFPRFNMPDWLRNITDYVPLTPVIDSVRYITTENYGIVELAPQLTIMLLWTVVIYAVAIRVFRWE